VLGGDLDADTTALDEIMPENVITCDIGAMLDDEPRLMQEYRVRRIPIMTTGD
jgi:CBS domain-containing protein